MRYKVIALKTRHDNYMDWKVPKISWLPEQKYTCIIISNHCNRVNHNPWNNPQLIDITETYTNRNTFSISHRPIPSNILFSNDDVGHLVNIVEDLIDIIQIQDLEYTLVATENSALLTILSLLLKPFNIEGCSDSIDNAFNYLNYLKRYVNPRRRGSIEEVREVLYNKYLGKLKPPYWRL